jgi:hypothetical protein
MMPPHVIPLQRGAAKIQQIAQPLNREVPPGEAAVINRNQLKPEAQVLQDIVTEEAANVPQVLTNPVVVPVVVRVLPAQVEAVHPVPAQVREAPVEAALDQRTGNN